MLGETELYSVTPRAKRGPPLVIARSDFPVEKRSNIIIIIIIEKRSLEV